MREKDEADFVREGQAVFPEVVVVGLISIGTVHGRFEPRFLISVGVLSLRFLSEQFVMAIK